MYDIPTMLANLAVLVTIAIVIVVLSKAAWKKISSGAEDYRRRNEGTSLRALKRLETLASLRDRGAITPAEFEAEKAKIIR